MKPMKVDETVAYRNYTSKNANNGSSENNYCKLHRRNSATDKPRRPLSGYNIFFQLERDRIVQGKLERPFTADDVANIRTYASGQKPKRRDRKVHGKIAFADLAKQIASKWNVLSYSERIVFEDRSKLEKEKYQRNLKVWTEMKQARSGSKKHPTEAPCTIGINGSLNLTKNDTRHSAPRKEDSNFLCTVSATQGNSSMRSMSMGSCNVSSLFSQAAVVSPNCMHFTSFDHGKDFPSDGVTSMSDLLAMAIQVPSPHSANITIESEMVSHYNNRWMSENSASLVPCNNWNADESDQPLSVRSEDCELQAFLEVAFDFENGIPDLAQKSAENVENKHVLVGEFMSENEKILLSISGNENSAYLKHATTKSENKIESDLFDKNSRRLPTASDLCNIFD